MREKVRKFFSLLKSDRLLLLAVALGLIDTSLFLYSYGESIREGMSSALSGISSYFAGMVIGPEDIQAELSNLNPAEPVEVNVKVNISEGIIHYLETGSTKGDRARERILTIMMARDLDEYMREEFSKESPESPLVSFSTLRLNDSTVGIKEMTYEYNPSANWIRNFKHLFMWFGWGNKLSWKIGFIGNYSEANCISVGFKDGVSGELDLTLPRSVAWYLPPKGGNKQFDMTLSGERVHANFTSGYGDKFTFCWLE